MKQQAPTRTLAQSINVAARQVEQTRADRRARVEAAQAELVAARSDQAAIEAAERDVTAAHDATAAITAGRDRLLELARAYSDQEVKEVRKADALVSEVQNLLAEQLQLPPSPATEIAAAAPALELEAGDEPTPEPLTAEAAVDESTTNGDGADAIEQIRRLGELRDAGLVSAEEFEVKKADLLSRL